MYYYVRSGFSRVNLICGVMRKKFVKKKNRTCRPIKADTYPMILSQLIMFSPTEHLLLVTKDIVHAILQVDETDAWHDAGEYRKSFDKHGGKTLPAFPWLK